MRPDLERIERLLGLEQEFDPGLLLSGGEREKWYFLRDAWRNDSKLPAVQVMAKALWITGYSDPLRFARMALAFCRDGILYQSDSQRTGGEDIAGLTREGTVAADMRRGFDDCDLKARVFVALCRARGLDAELLPVIEPAAGGPVLSHVRARVLINRRWYTAEPSLARARLGEVPGDVPKEADGKWAR